MRDLCVPIPRFDDDQVADVEISVKGDRKKFSFRVESFPWNVNDELSSVADDEVSLSLVRITRLKNAINNYDPSWELIQIFTPAENARHIQVLYRKKI